MYCKVLKLSTGETIIGSIIEETKVYVDVEKPIKIVVAGGTSKANGYIENFKNLLEENNFPLPIKEVVHAKEPLLAVSKGCLIASSIL